MEINTNRKYKDSVFTKLFGETETLLELYNAIQDTNYGKDTEIQITTLENVLYMEQMNDISFTIDGKIVVLIEHQSTINPNMPLRMLLYIARTYERITQRDDLYKHGKITIPRPEFIVLYNGKDKYPDKNTLKLSEMFAQYGEKSPIELELEVKVYNINKGHNPELAKKSVTLDGYEEFIAAVRDYEKQGMKREAAITQAVKDCINRNILKNFLETNSSEVINMLLTDWNMEDALRVREQEGMQRGMQKGMQEILEHINRGLSLSEIKNMLSSSLAHR